MSDIGGGNSVFDVTFFALEKAGAILVVALLLALFVRRRLGHELPDWSAALLLILALMLGPGVSIYWQVAYPSANGIEGAGRFLLGGAITLANASLASAGALPLLEGRARWIAIAPVAADLMFWLVFLFS